MWKEELPPSWQEMAGARTEILAGEGQCAGWLPGDPEEVAEWCGRQGARGKPVMEILA